MPGPDGALVFEDIPYLFPTDLRDDLLRDLRRAHRTFTESTPDGSDALFFKRVVPMLHHAWVDNVALRPLPTMTTTEGDPLVFTKVVLDLDDAGAARDTLSGRPEFEPQDDGSWVWLEEGEEPRRIFGTVTIQGSRLSLETVSEPRAERGRRLVEEILGKRVRYRATVTEDALEAAGRMGDKPGRQTDTIPPEVEAQVVTEMLDRHYHEWVDTPIPALGDRTPRHAARLKTGRPKVVVLLKQLENQAERDRLEGRPAYDAAWLWDELGLERPEHSKDSQHTYDRPPRDDMPPEMSQLFGRDWDSTGALRLNSSIGIAELDASPLFHNARSLLAAVVDAGGVRATAAGNLNRALVLAQFDQLRFADPIALKRANDFRPRKEEDVLPLHVARLLLELPRLLRRTKGVFRATKRGAAHLQEERAGDLFALLFRTHFQELNLAYLDRLAPAPEFQAAVPYMLWALAAVEDAWWTDDDLVPLVVPPSVREVIPVYELANSTSWLLSSRLLRPLANFGLLTIRERPPEQWWEHPVEYRKTPLFDRFLQFRLEGPGPSASGGLRIVK